MSNTTTLKVKAAVTTVVGPYPCRTILVCGYKMLVPMGSTVLVHYRPTVARKK